MYTELPIARHLQGMWVSWLHEFDDGQLGGGSFWQGRDGVAFGPGYQLKDGVTTAHTGIVAKPTFNQAGRMSALEATIGADSYTFTFESSGSPLRLRFRDRNLVGCAAGAKLVLGRVRRKHADTGTSRRGHRRVRAGARTRLTTDQMKSDPPSTLTVAPVT